jgi:hypothetical protein
MSKLSEIASLFGYNTAQSFPTANMFYADMEHIAALARRYGWQVDIASSTRIYSFLKGGHNSFYMRDGRFFGVLEEIGPNGTPYLPRQGRYLSTIFTLLYRIHAGQEILEQEDKEIICRLAQNPNTRDDPAMAALLVFFNNKFPARDKRILLKNLSAAYAYAYGISGTKVLVTQRMLNVQVTRTTRMREYSIERLCSPSFWAQVFITGLAIESTEAQPANEAPCSILNYSTKVEQYIPMKQSKDVLFGVELELEDCTPTRLSKAHAHLKKHCIFKRDGSVPNGVEIVSTPASVKEHKDAFRAFFAEGAVGMNAKGNCGIHIHASRKGMSFLQLGRIHAFLSKNKDNITKIAGRESTYARFRDRADVLDPWYSAASDKYHPDKRFSWDKYTAVNLAPAATIEFRIFKSTTDWAEFCRFLEFPEAVISYCALSGDDNHGKIRGMADLMQFSNFKDFVAARGSVYPELNKFIQKDCH